MNDTFPDMPGLVFEAAGCSVLLLKQQIFESKVLFAVALHYINMGYFNSKSDLLNKWSMRQILYSTVFFIFIYLSSTKLPEL